LERLKSEGGTFVGLITKPDSLKGRGLQKSENELVAVVRDLDLPIFKPANDQELSDAINRLNPEVVLTISYGRLVKQNELRIPRYGWINLHFSLLPKYRGAAPVQWTIMNGDKRTGVTVFRLDEGMDTGPILSFRELELTGRENTAELLNQLAEMGAEAVNEAFAELSNGSPGVPQPKNGSLAPKITKELAHIKWADPSLTIERLIRAMAPRPGAWTTLNGERIRIFTSETATERGEPGVILNVNPLTIGTGDSALIIGDVQGEGKRRMTSSDWQRGARIKVGDRFL
jgi:methionyl-tRNA formyltransferase